MKRKFHVSLVKYVPVVNGSTDIFDEITPVLIKEWEGLSQLEALKLFIKTIKLHPDAYPDYDSIDSIEWTENGELYSLFVKR